MAITLEQFVRHLTDSGLLSTDDISSFQNSLPSDQEPEDTQAFVRELVQAGKLTEYQAQAVCEGAIEGLVFDEYVVLDKIGAGGMGEVLKAQHRRMNRLVAVKRLPFAATKTEEKVKRFYREVEAAARLSHPNIVTAHDAREHNGRHYLIMEYVDGKDLSAIVHEHGPLPVEHAVQCVLQAARGLTLDAQGDRRQFLQASSALFASAKPRAAQ